MLKTETNTPAIATAPKTPAEKASASTFEAQVCGRCGGSGRFSYNTMTGDRCFSCGGAGWHLTTRGSVAARYLTGLLSKPLSEVRIGERICLLDYLANRWEWQTLQAIRRCDLNPGLVYFTTDKGGIGAWERDGSVKQPVRFAATVEEKKAALAKALAYQATLTKGGKPLRPRGDAPAAVRS